MGLGTLGGAAPVLPALWVSFGEGGEQGQGWVPLLVAELEGRAVQRVPQLQSVVTAAQAFTPVPLAFPASLATQLYPAWVGGQGSGAMWEPTGPLPPPLHSHQ